MLHRCRQIVQETCKIQGSCSHVASVECVFSREAAWIVHVGRELHVDSGCAGRVRLGHAHRAGIRHHQAMVQQLQTISTSV